MSLCDELLSGNAALSVTGLGYVGMPLAVAYSKKMRVIGFDLNQSKIEAYNSGIDPTGEVLSMTTRPNGLVVGKKRVPLGVVGIIFESRPNVTVDAAAQ